MDTMYTYNKIKNLCTAHGTNISNLESAIGVGTSTIQRWKTNSPSSDTLLKVADYFHVSVDYLLGHKIGKWNDADYESIFGIPADILKSICKLNDSGLEIVEALVSGLAIQKEYRK